MICYNPRVILRALAVATCLLLPAPVLAADAPAAPARIATTSTGSAMVQTTAGAAAADTGMRPGVPKAPVSKHPFFFAAYAVVWAVLFAYAIWLGTRIRSLEQKVASATNRSR